MDLETCKCVVDLDKMEVAAQKQISVSSITSQNSGTDAAEAVAAADGSGSEAVNVAASQLPQFRAREAKAATAALESMGPLVAHNAATPPPPSLVLLDLKQQLGAVSKGKHHRCTFTGVRLPDMRLPGLCY